MAAFNGKRSIIKLLVEEFGIALDSVQHMGARSVTPLHRAIYGRQRETVEQLLMYCANVRLGGRRWNFTKFTDAVDYAELVKRPEIKEDLIAHQDKG